jgi:hypothetical protein
MLLAFAKDPDGALAKMPRRVQRAPHLGGLVLDEPRTDIDDPRNARGLIDVWRGQARHARVGGTAPGSDASQSRAADGAGHPVMLTEFQADWQNFALTMKQAGFDA